MVDKFLKDLCLELVHQPPLEQLAWIKRFPQLLTNPETDRVLEQLPGELEEFKNYRVNVTRATLRQARYKGSAAGIEETYMLFHQKWEAAKDAFEKLVEAPTVRAMRLVVIAHPVLLTDLGIAVMYEAYSHYFAEKGRDWGEWVRIHGDLLFRCRQFGVEYAIDELRQGTDNYWFLDPKPW